MSSWWHQVGGEDSLFDLSRSISCIRVIMHIVKRLFEPRGKSLDCLNTSFRYKFYNPQFPYMQFYCWNYFDIFNATWNLRQQMNYDWKFTSPHFEEKNPPGPFQLVRHRAVNSKQISFPNIESRSSCEHQWVSVVFVIHFAWIPSQLWRVAFTMEAGWL